MTTKPSDDPANGEEGVVKNDDLVEGVERNGDLGLVVGENEDRKDRNRVGDGAREREGEFFSCVSTDEGDATVEDDGVNKDDSFQGVETNGNDDRSGDLGTAKEMEVEDDQRDVNGDRESEKTVGGHAFVEKGGSVVEGDEGVKNSGSEPSCYLDEEGGKVKAEERERLGNEEEETGDVMEGDRCIHYDFPLQEKDRTGLLANDFVWAKVRSHPWWPGQIFNPKHASETALKRQKKDCLLVAYLGDRTFAWVPESQLRPFQAHFSTMVKQSGTVPFVNAVDDALEEVTRQVELGMACHCWGDESRASSKCRKLENAGIQKGTCRAAFDRSMLVNGFRAKSLLEYVCALAQHPFGEFDRLELTIARAQLKDFYRSKGLPELPVSVYEGGFVENDAEISPANGKSGKTKADSSTLGASSIKSEKRPRGRRTKSHLSEDDDGFKCLSKKKEEAASSVRSGKRPRIRTHQNKMSEDGSGQKNRYKRMEEDVDRHGHKSKSVTKASSKKQRVVDSNSGDLVRSQQEKHGKEVDLDVDAPSSTRAKIGDRIRRAISQLNVSPLNLKSSDETLQQLYVLASDPTQGCDSLPMTVGFFTKFKDSNSSGFSEDRELVKAMGRLSGTIRRAVNFEGASSEMPEPDSMQDSYWSDIILENSPDKQLDSKGRKRKWNSQKKGQNKKTKPNDKQEVGGRGIVNGLEEIKGETPTALILSFSESDALPSAADLINIFRPYGPLREEDTEILRKSSRVKVVFRHRHDAEKAYSSAGKYSIFGPALVRYRLRYPPPPKSSPGNSPQKSDAAPIQDGNLED